MEINISDFTKFVGRKTLKIIGVTQLGRAHKIVAKHYCRKLTLRSACSEQCQACTAHITTRLQRANPNGVKYPYALFMWLLRDALALAIEAEAQKKKAPVENKKNIYGEAKKENTLDALEALYG